MIFHIFTQLCRELHCQCVCYFWETDSVVFVLNFRAYIEFEKPRFADQGLESNAIVPAVYKAIKMRLVSISLGHFRIVFCLGIKMSVRVKPFKWNFVRPTGLFNVNQTRFCLKGFEWGLVLKQEKDNSEIEFSFVYHVWLHVRDILGWWRVTPISRSWLCLYSNVTQLAG